MQDKIYIIVPFYNEEKLIRDLVDSLKKQTDQFFYVVYVNNNSADASVEVISTHQKDALFTYEIIEEHQKGTGCAADSGFRYAITTHHAKYLARTDADCIPDINWVKSIRKNLIKDNLDFIAGYIKPRTDEIPPLSFIDKMLIPFLLFSFNLLSKLKSGFFGYKYIYFMVAGNNLAITAPMYEKSGGFPRTAIDTVDEDFVLGQSVRKLTKRVRRCRDMVEYNSTRRFRAYGSWNIFMWHHGRAYKPEIVDIR